MPSISEIGFLPSKWFPEHSDQENPTGQSPYWGWWFILWIQHSECWEDFKFEPNLGYRASSKSTRYIAKAWFKTNHRKSRLHFSPLYSYPKSPTQGPTHSRTPELQINHLHENPRPGVGLGITILYFRHQNYDARSPQTTSVEYWVVSTHPLPELSSMKIVFWNEESFLNAGLRDSG